MTPPPAVEFALAVAGAYPRSTGLQSAGVRSLRAGLLPRRTIRSDPHIPRYVVAWMICSGLFDHLESVEIAFDKRSHAGIAVRRIERRPPLPRRQCFIIGFSLSIWGSGCSPTRPKRPSARIDTRQGDSTSSGVAVHRALPPRAGGKPPSCYWGALPVRSCGCSRRL